jgi:hypothetical protein
VEVIGQNDGGGQIERALAHYHSQGTAQALDVGRFR